MSEGKKVKATWDNKGKYICFSNGCILGLRGKELDKFMKKAERHFRKLENRRGAK